MDVPLDVRVREALVDRLRAASAAKTRKSMRGGGMSGGGGTPAGAARSRAWGQFKKTKHPKDPLTKAEWDELYDSWLEFKTESPEAKLSAAEYVKLERKARSAAKKAKAYSQSPAGIAEQEAYRERLRDAELARYAASAPEIPLRDSKEYLSDSDTDEEPEALRPLPTKKDIEADTADFLKEFEKPAKKARKPRAKKAATEKASEKARKPRAKKAATEKAPKKALTKKQAQAFIKVVRASNLAKARAALAAKKAAEKASGVKKPRKAKGIMCFVQEDGTLKSVEDLYVMSPKGRRVLKTGPTGRRVLRAAAKAAAEAAQAAA